MLSQWNDHELNWNYFKTLFNMYINPILFLCIEDFFVLGIQELTSGRPNGAQEAAERPSMGV